MSIYRASRLVGINGATAKDIVRKYREDGTVYVRKGELRKIEDGSLSPIAEPIAEVPAQPEEDGEENQQGKSQPGEQEEVLPQDFSQSCLYMPYFPMMVYSWFWL